MRREDMINSMLEITQLEIRNKELGLEWQKAYVKNLLVSVLPGSFNDLDNPEMESLMLHYGLKGKDTYGPSPIVHSRPSKTYIADGVNADDQGIGKWLVVQRHSRYTYWVEHSHSFIEIIFMMNGHCTNIVNGKTIHMQCGDFLIMAPGSRHRIEPLGDEDLLINLILLPISAEMILEKTISGKSDFAQYLIAAFYSSSSKSNYVYLNSQGEEDIFNTTCDLIKEYFDQTQIASDVLVECRMHEIFALLWRFSEQHPDRVSFAFKPNSQAAMIINYIKDNCVACTRKSVGEHFSYSPSRIGNILTESIGKGFLDLRNEFRMNLAESKLMSTNFAVKTVAEECGFTNVTQFYKVYKEHFGKLPRNERLIDK